MQTLCDSWSKGTFLKVAINSSTFILCLLCRSLFSKWSIIAPSLTNYHNFPKINSNLLLNIVYHREGYHIAQIFTIISYCRLFFHFWTTPHDSQELFLALLLGIIPGKAQRTIRDTRYWTWVVNALPDLLLLLWPLCP